MTQPMTMLEIALVAAAALLLLGYHLYFLRQLAKAPNGTAVGIAQALRHAWIERVISRNDGLLAVQTLRNWIMTASFLASTSIIIAVGLLGFLVGSDKVSGLMHQINFLGHQGDTLITVKLLLLVANFFAAFFSFSLSLRAYNYVGLMVIRGDGDGERNLGLASHFLARGAAHYTIGMRGYYLAIPLALWLFGPIWLLAGSVVLTVALYKHDHVAIRPAATPQTTSTSSQKP